MIAKTIIDIICRKLAYSFIIIWHAFLINNPILATLILFQILLYDHNGSMIHTYVPIVVTANYLQTSTTSHLRVRIYFDLFFDSLYKRLCIFFHFQSSTTSLHNSPFAMSMICKFTLVFASLQQEIKLQRFGNNNVLRVMIADFGSCQTKAKGERKTIDAEK